MNRRTLLLALPLLGLIGARGRVRKLWWRGKAHVEAGGRSLDLVVETNLELPLIRVRSTSYIEAQGLDTARTMILEPDGAWVERGGTRQPLPAQLGIHERQQYAMYGWLLKVLHGGRRKPGRLPLSAPPWPDIVFEIGGDGYPIAAEWTVDAPEAGQPRIAQEVRFSGWAEEGGVRWPRRFEMTQVGKPYFDLRVEEFRAS